MKDWEQFFREMDKIGDPLADHAVASMLSMGRVGFKAIHQLFRDLVNNNTALPPELQCFFETSSQLPAWADAEQLKNGQRFFNLHGPKIVMALFCASLPLLYSTSRGTVVLSTTQGMSKYVTERIFDTARFVLEVTAADAFTPEGHGIRSIQRVRLIHAVVRYILRNEARCQNIWLPEWGTPISQSESIGTILAFSLIVIQCLEKSGIYITPEEKAGYLHLWKVIGHNLGVCVESLPDDMDELTHIADLLFSMNYAVSEMGQELVRDLVKFMQSYPPALYIPGFATDWIRFCIGEEIANGLGLPAYGWTYRLVQMQQFSWRVESQLVHRIPFAAPMILLFNRWYLERQLKFLSGTSKKKRHMPPGLSDKLRSL